MTERVVDIAISSSENCLHCALMRAARAYGAAVRRPLYAGDLLDALAKAAADVVADFSPEELSAATDRLVEDIFRFAQVSRAFRPEATGEAPQGTLQ